jgi:AbrB family looped-hinge helix DNA binding protein
LKALARVDQKGRITIPLFIREALGLRPETTVAVEVDEEKGLVILRPIFSGNEFLMEYEVLLGGPEVLEDLIRCVIDEGAEVRYLKCLNEERGSKCTLIASVIDAKAGNSLRARLTDAGIKVISSGPAKGGLL